MTTKRDSLLLTIDLVPAASWSLNLHKILPKNKWRKIREEIISKSGGLCIICGGAPPLECHEVWDYDDTDHVQTLTGFLALCKKCHAIKHIGFKVQAGAEKEELIRHFMRVNKCDRSVFNTHYKKAMDEFDRRSKFEWVINFSS